MPPTRWWVWIGAGLSLGLLVVLIWRLDWGSFWKALEMLRPAWAAGTAACLVLGIGTRALRWNVLAGVPLQRYWRVWQSASLGYLGNMIYPARAGEFLRVAAISRFAQVPAGAAVTSAVLDRIFDGLFWGLMLIVVILHGTSVPGHAALFGVTSGVAVAGVLAISFILWGDQFEARLTRWLTHAPPSFKEKGIRWYGQATAATHVMRRPRQILSVLLLTVVAFGLDFLSYWLLLKAFGWSLPAMAAITLGVFVLLGASLPSAPGYIGIHQLACILALHLFGIPESHAIAYSVVFQLLMFLVIGVQGGWAMVSCGLRLSDLPPTPAQGARESS